jgi:putative ABC transport system permease protein
MPWYLRWRNAFRSERLNDELDCELQYHLAETVDDLISGGMTEKDAVREARRRLGNYSIQKERTRDMNIAAWLEATRADVVYGARQLRLNPGFASIAILSLALGIGANTAIFQLVNAIRLKTLPVKDPQQLVSIDFAKGSSRAGSWSSRSANFTYAQWEQIRAQQQAFTDVFAWSAAQMNLANGGQPRFAQALYVSGNFFTSLGVQAVMGRTLTAQDDGAACNVGAVVSYPFWQREMGGTPGVLGRTVSLDGHAVPIMGVTPPSFFGVEVGYQYDVAVPLCADRMFAEDGKSRIPERFDWWLSLMGRLKPGWSVEQATAQLHAISPSVMRETLPPQYKPDLVKRFLKDKLEASDADNGISGLRQRYDQPLWLMMATAGLVLLIACANLANLLLARATVREPEIAVRLAIGASRWRLIRQLMAESLLLAVTGAVLGAGLAVALSRALVAYISTKENPIFVDVALDWRVLAFAGGLAVLTCMLFGLLPALRATYLSPVAAMRSGGRSVTASRERFSIRQALVATQVALSLVLLVGAFLFVRSLHNLMNADNGFQPQSVLTVSVDFSKAQYAKERRLEVYRELQDRLAAIPGVLSVGDVMMTPISGSGWNNSVGPDKSPAAGSGKDSNFNRVGPGYFKAMDTRLLAGREFNTHDTLSSTPVAIVNEAFAKKMFGGANPVGRTFHLEKGAGQPEPLIQIVGLVENTKYYNVQEDFRPIGFFPIAQDDNPGPGTNFVLRTAGPPGRFDNSVKNAVIAMSPVMGVLCQPFSVQLNDSLLRERLMAWLSGGFGFLAGLLATMGLYGVIAYMVARRQHEIGVRIALGASGRNVISLVLREALLLLAIGLPVGALLAIWAGRAAATLLYQLKPYDAVSLFGAAALLAIIALIASYIPARRAAALNPMTALRNE